MLEFIQKVLNENGMKMDKGKTYEYDFDKKTLIIRDIAAAPK